MKRWVLAAGLLAAAFATTGAKAADLDDGPPPPPRKYGYDGPPPRAYAPTRCTPREEVRAELTREGWHDFHDAEPQGEVVNIRARRPSGRLFALTIHRCSGELIEARPLEPRRYAGPYAYGGPYAYERPYAYYGGPGIYIGPGYRHWRRW